MLDNLVVAFSNIFFIFPMYLSLKNSDYLTWASVTFVAFASFISHLVENHKHNMSGPPCLSEKISRKISLQTNFMDRIAVFFVSLRFVILYYTYDFYVPNNEFLLIMITAMIGLLGQCEIPIEYKWIHYIPLHSMWHILVARQMYIILKLMYVQSDQ